MPTDLGWETNIQIGLTQATMEDVKVDPIVEFFPGTNPERNVCGGATWQGSPQCRWTYPDRLLTGEQFYQLQQLVGDAPTVAVYMTVPTQRVDPATYQPSVVSYYGIMHWPEEGVMVENFYRWKLPDDGILFTNLQGL